MIAKFSCINYLMCVCVSLSHRLGLMLVSSSPRESLCLGRSVRTSQKELPPLASSWMTFPWYEAAGETLCINYYLLYTSWCFFGLILTVGNNCIVFFQTHLTFGKEFTEAVEMKQVAQQEAERARFIVEKVMFLTQRSSLYYFCIWKLVGWKLEGWNKDIVN